MPLSLRKRGKVWHARGVVPAKQPDGKIKNVTIERSTRTESRTRARQIAADLERYYHDLAFGNIEERGPTFAEAAITYIRTRGKSDRFITALIKHFGETPVKSIGQAEAVKAAQELYPGWKQSSLQRAVWTPLSAIGVGGLTRPTIEPIAVDLPKDEWFVRFLASEPPPKLAAMVLFITLTGRRVGEVIALTEKDIDDRGMVHIARTKTGVPVTVAMPDICRELLLDRDGYYARKGTGQPSKRLFGYANLPGAYVALRRACRRAGIPVYRFHAIGRHSFATRALKAGKSIKWVKEAGGWESLASVARYLHLEQSEVQREKDSMGREWARGLTKPKNTGEKATK